MTAPGWQLFRRILDMNSSIEAKSGSEFADASSIQGCKFDRQHAPPTGGKLETVRPGHRRFHQGRRERIEREKESRARVNLAFCPDTPTVSGEDSANSGQADADAGKLAAGVKSLERLEEAVSIALIESGSVVADKEDTGFAPMRAAELNPRDIASTSELPRVAQQVLQDNLHQAGIGVYLAFRLNDGFDMAVRSCFAEALKDGTRHMAQVDGLPMQGRTRRPG